ncbi:MAG: hypothetical protein ACPGYT_16125 [Nitrospirales bacterium]
MDTRLLSYCAHALSLCLAKSLFLCTAWIISIPTDAVSSGFHSPDECLAYTQEAHLNCLYAYIEIQQDKIRELESTVNKEKRTSQRFQDDVNHQLSINDLLQQQIRNQKNDINASRNTRIHIYSGFSYYLGQPRYYRRFFQPHLGFQMGYDYPDW